MLRQRFTGLSALALLLVCGASPAMGQSPVAVVAGPNLSSISSDQYETSGRAGFFVHVGTSFPLRGIYALEVWGGFVRKGTKFENGTEATYDFIQVPVLLTARFPLNDRFTLGVSAGPQVGLSVGCREPVDDQIVDCENFFDDFNTNEFGLVAAARVSFPISETLGLSLGVGADFGLSDMFESVDYKTRTYFLSVGLGVLRDD